MKSGVTERFRNPFLTVIRVTDLVSKGKCRVGYFPLAPLNTSFSQMIVFRDRYPR